MVEGPATNTGQMLILVAAILLVAMFIVAILTAGFINQMCKKALDAGSSVVQVPLINLKISVSSVCNIAAP
jgi:hypothetical protein